MAFGTSDNGYKNGNRNRNGQGGPSYPLSPGTSNPLQDVRDTYQQSQEMAYKMMPGRFMPAQNPNAVDMNSDGRATTRDGGYQPGDQNFDLRVTSFAALDQNLRSQWITGSEVDSVNVNKLS